MPKNTNFAKKIFSMIWKPMNHLNENLENIWVFSEAVNSIVVDIWSP